MLFVPERLALDPKYIFGAEAAREVNAHARS